MATMDLASQHFQTRVLDRAAELVAKETGQTDMEALKRTIATCSRAMSTAMMEIHALNSATDTVLQPT